MRDLGDIYPSLYPVEGFPPVDDSWLPLLHLEEFPNNHDHSQPFILKYQRCLIDFRTIHNMWSLLWSENKWDLGNVQRWLSPVSRPFYNTLQMVFLFSTLQLYKVHRYTHLIKPVVGGSFVITLLASLTCWHSNVDI